MYEGELKYQDISDEGYWQVNWAANKSFEISKFKFNISESSNLRTSQVSFSAVQVPARVPKRAPLVELVLTMTSMRRERKDRYCQCVCGGDHTDQRLSLIHI